ncbi:MAG TPA: HAD hydrolase-like protein [Geobacteraceae bacterium]
MKGELLDCFSLLFDLDGTLTDPVQGIARSISHALGLLGVSSPSHLELARYVGPPLRHTFAELLGTGPDDSRVERAMELYRVRFSATGMYENAVYPGVPAMLAALREEGFDLFVATSKPRVFAVRICEHFGFHRYLRGIYGPELNGWYDDKGELLGHLLAEEGIAAHNAVMVGDREHDVSAAKKNGIAALGVTWGYGSRRELLDAGANLLCRTPEDVRGCLYALGAHGALTTSLFEPAAAGHIRP